MAISLNGFPIYWTPFIFNVSVATWTAVPPTLSKNDLLVSRWFYVLRHLRLVSVADHQTLDEQVRGIAIRLETKRHSLSAMAQVRAHQQRMKDRAHKGRSDKTSKYKTSMKGKGYSR